VRRTWRVEDRGGPTIRAPSQIRTIAAVVVLALAGTLSTGVHTVRAGETLGGIAGRHGTTVSALASANGISDPNRIRAGQQLRIPGAGSGGAQPPGSGTGTYVVRAGDTLGGIAARHGTTVSALASLNAIRDPNRVVVGTTLRLPAGGSGGSSPSPAAGSPATHVVAPGETIAGIARRYGITASQLIEANGLVDGRIYAHQRLFLSPPGPTPTVPSSSEVRHVVSLGETLSVIARRYGATIDAIAGANGISDPNRVRAGTELRIPGGNGSLVCPVPGARFVNDWGFPRSGGRFHMGNDMFAPRGTPVRAPVDGTVTQVTGTMAGLQVNLVTADGTRWAGTHLDRFGASGRVRAGDVIGYVGDTGNARGGPPHLHIEVHPTGSGAVNPFPLLVAACR
jgi:LysM repeat protein